VDGSDIDRNRGIAALYRQNFMIHMKYRKGITDYMHSPDRYTILYHDCVLGQTVRARNVGEFEIFELPLFKIYWYYV
jgi:hypothetical protein